MWEGTENSVAGTGCPFSAPPLLPHGVTSSQASCGYPPHLFPSTTVFPSGAIQDPRATALWQLPSLTLCSQTVQFCALGH